MATCLIQFFWLRRQSVWVSFTCIPDWPSERRRQAFFEKLNYCVTIPCRVCSSFRAGSYCDRTRRLEHHWNLLLGRKNSSSRRSQRACGSWWLWRYSASASSSQRSQQHLDRVAGYKSCVQRQIRWSTQGLLSDWLRRWRRFHLRILQLSCCLWKETADLSWTSELHSIARRLLRQGEAIIAPISETSGAAIWPLRYRIAGCN